MLARVFGFIVFAHIVFSKQLDDLTPTEEVRGFYKREHSLLKPYQSSGMSVPYWDFVGSTMVTHQYIRLTANAQSRSGGLWNASPIRMRDWEVVLTVNVHGTTGELFGDGLAFWFTKDRNQLGPVFGGVDHFTGLGIFLDTYSNHNGPHNHAHPYLSAMVNNGTLHYDHDRDGTHTQLGNAGCTAKLRNKDYDTSILIRYVDDTLSVYTDIDNQHKWRQCFSVEGVRLPTGYYFGLSAATGELSDNHDIVAIKTYEIELARPEKEPDVDRTKIQPEAAHYAAPRDHIADPKPSRLSGFGTTLFVIIALVAVAAVIVIGVITLQKRQESSRKRFY